MEIYHKCRLSLSELGRVSAGCMFIILVGTFLISGCAASLKNLAPQLEPITVNQGDMKPISFKGVVLRIPVGEKIGSHHDGLAKVAQYSLHWQSGISFGSEEFTLGASETLRQCGYRVIGGDNLLFQSNEGAKANYQLGATIVGLRYNTFGSLAGNYNEAVVYVEWQLFDAFQKQIVFEHSTEGFAKMSPRTKPAVFEAFNNALRNLLADNAFVETLKRAEPSQMASIPEDDLLLIKTSTSTPVTLPDQMGAVLPCVVTVRVGSTLGSGFIVSPSGYAITAAHVVSGVDEAQLVFNSGLTLTASVVKIDNHQDIALLKLPGSGHKCLELALTESPQLGSEIFAIGTPYSEELSFSVTRGIVSGLRDFNGIPYIQTDASLSPGNSGGPLLNDLGQVVGVVSWKIAAPGFEGLAFGVPISAIEESLHVSFEKDNSAEN